MHGTLPWTSPSTRTTLFYKYTRRGEAYCGEVRARSVLPLFAPLLLLLVSLLIVWLVAPGQNNYFYPSDADPWGSTARARYPFAPPPPPPPPPPQPAPCCV
eukprot:COSAG04_NODE_652_length_11552_cov_10.246136_4_plen_101_part_00